MLSKAEDNMKDMDDLVVKIKSALENVSLSERKQEDTNADTISKL